MLTLVLLIISSLAPSIFGIRLTLENGATGSANKEIVVGQLSRLTCTYQLESPRNGPVDIFWGYSVAKNSGLQHIIVHGGVLQEDYAETFTFLPPSSLQINSAAVADAGLYECRVTVTGEGVGVGSYNVTVLVPPAVPTCGFPSGFTLTVGYSAEFQCHSSEGIPSPTYQWYKGNTLLPLNSQNDKRYKNTSFSYSKTTGTLKFSEVTPADAGTYFCRAMNKVGSEQCHAVAITTKSQDIGMIVGIAFGVIFGLLLLGALLWWSWREGYWQSCIRSNGANGMDGDDGNDVMLDGHGPMVTKPTGRYNGGPRRKQEASMMI